MIKNYLKITIRILTKNKIYSIISISSLSIGLAVCLMLLMYVQNELSYDRYHEKSDNIYRLCQEVHPYQAPGSAKMLAEKLPEIKNYARILPRDNILVQFDDQRYKEDMVAWVDPELFEIFSFEFIEGNIQNSLQQPGTAVLTEKTARKYFGDEDVMGKTFQVSSEYDYTVVGIIKDIQQNSHFTFDLFLTLEDGDEMFGDDWMSSWGWWNFLAYFEMQDNFSKPDFETKVSEIMNSINRPSDPDVQFTVQSIADIHLYSTHFLGDIQPQSSITFVLIFSGIGLLILIIASFNYINLLTANATARGKEIGIRKTFGAVRAQLATQYISESIIVFLISFLVSLIIVWFSLPLFNEVSGKDLSFSILSDPKVILSVLAMMLVISTLAGWYPAFVLSSYNPTKVMNSSKSGIGSGSQIKKILVGAQFTIVIVLIACAVVMFRQVNYLQKKDLGFDKEAVLTAIFDFGDEDKYNAVKQAMLEQSFVKSVSVASQIPSGSLSNLGSVLPEGQTEAIEIPYVHINFDYFKTLGIEANQGRLFSEDFKTDTIGSVILNEAAVKSLGIKGNPIGQSVKCNWPESIRKIVGVIDDINFESLYNKVKPAVFVIHYPLAYHIIVKVKPTDIIISKNALTEVCQSIYPNEIIEFSFLDNILEQRYLKDYTTYKLVGFFTFLAIFLSSMGLLGMASFMLVSRTKEIGIRKVNGATVSEILQLLNKDFIIWVVIAFVIATPIAWYSMDIWLQNFAYQTTLTWWVFALAGLIALVIVLFTVSWLTFSAARRNPVEALRYE